MKSCSLRSMRPATRERRGAGPEIRNRIAAARLPPSARPQNAEVSGETLMSRFSRPLQGIASRQAKRIRPAFYGCLIGVGISQFFYPHVRPDNVDPTSGSSFALAVIESCDRSALPVCRHKEDRASDAFSLGFGKQSGLASQPRADFSTLLSSIISIRSVMHQVLSDSCG